MDKSATNEGLLMNKQLQQDDYCWMPANKASVAKFMNALRQDIRKKYPVLATVNMLQTDEISRLHPIMQEFKNMVETNAIIRMGFTKMIDQVPGFYRDQKEAHGYYLESIDEMICMINEIITTAPKYNQTDLVGFPINYILNWTMGVPAGAEVFRNPDLNAMFKKVLNSWSEFLDSRDSLYVFTNDPTTGGWCSKPALQQLDMSQYLDAKQLDHFISSDDPVTDLNFPYVSWNDFFTRHFKNATQRPVSSDPGIVSGCDSKIYNIQSQARLEDWFWVKAQPYSLRDMLAGPDMPEASDKEKLQSDQDHFKQYIAPFEGGTVYQAFLSATKYHRWHSPVSGTIKKTYVKDGTYYSAALAEGMDVASPDQSQGYIAHTAARAMIFIQADDPSIGLMCMMPIGMAEVSSCIVTASEEQHIEKGDEVGYFQYGGSTHCLVFQKGVIDQFTCAVGEEVQVGELIATIHQK